MNNTTRRKLCYYVYDTPPSLLPIHPQPYEFWISSNANAMLFEQNPFKWLPAFGGHCTHGISEAFGGMTARDIVDGRRGFTCINGPRWVVLNETLYMNSCSMYEDFIKDPLGMLISSFAFCSLSFHFLFLNFLFLNFSEKKKTCCFKQVIFIKQQYNG